MEFSASDKSIANLSSKRNKIMQWLRKDSWRRNLYAIQLTKSRIGDRHKQTSYLPWSEYPNSSNELVTWNEAPKKPKPKKKN